MVHCLFRKWLKQKQGNKQESHTNVQFYQWFQVCVQRYVCQRHIALLWDNLQMQIPISVCGCEFDHLLPSDGSKHQLCFTAYIADSQRDKSCTVTCCLLWPISGSNSLPTRAKLLFCFSKSLPVSLQNRSVLIQVVLLLLLQYLYDYSKSKRQHERSILTCEQDRSSFMMYTS